MSDETSIKGTQQPGPSGDVETAFLEEADFDAGCCRGEGWYARWSGCDWSEAEGPADSAADAEASLRAAEPT